MTDRRVLVVGAGISGLCAAIALHRAGAHVDVVESSPEHSPVGAGIILGANAVAALAFLGVDIVDRGVPIDGMKVRSANGRLLQEVPASLLGAAVGLTRRTLHGALDESLPDGVAVRFAETADSLHQDPGGVDVTFASGTGERYDLVIGADGLRSRTRAQAGEDPRVQYSGYTCWRLLTADPGVGEVCEYWGRGERAGLVPVDGGRVYAYLVRDAPELSPGPSGAQELADSFAAFPPVVADLVRSAGDDGLIHHDLSELSRQSWGSGRVWLVGDAAHAMLPNLGQGAAMGIEDAVALPAALAEPDPAAGLRTLVDLRRDRVERIRRDSRRVGRIGQWHGAVACRLRDIAYGALPASVGVRQARGVVQPGLDLVAAAAALGPTAG